MSQPSSNILGKITGVFLPVLLCSAGLAVTGAQGQEKWARLLARDPFTANQPPPPPPPEPPPPPLELRGVLVEKGVTWLNVYNGETKESAWVKKGERIGSFVVHGYDAAKDAALLESPQRKLAVALKQSKMQLLAGSARNNKMMAFQAMPAANPATTAMASPLPVSEAKRLEQVAEEIRERREQRKRQISQTST